MPSKKSLWNVIKYILLPLGLLVDGLKIPGRSIGKKVLVTFAVLFISWIWGTSIYQIKITVDEIMFKVGIFKDNLSVPISGTSMLPTIQDNSEVKLTSVGAYKFKRGDVVVFSNPQTSDINYIKRIVGMPGEDIVVKNGLVFINGIPLNEPYIYQNFGTYGNTFLLECQLQKVPEDSYAVMGDNRMVSWDSRAIGFINKKDIKGYTNSDTYPTFENQSKIKISENYKLDAAKVISLLNAKRIENGMGSVLPSDTLSRMANKRSDYVSQNLDSWKANQLPIEKTLDGMGYKYNLAYEFVTFGYVDEEGVVNQIMDNPDAKDVILSSKFWEAGIGFTNVTRGDCKYPVISLILTWPSVPTYSKKSIDWWKREERVTSDVLGVLQSWVGFSQKDQTKLKESIALTAKMNMIASRISKKMSSKKWLEQQDYADIDNYEEMINTNNKFQEELFPKIKGVESDAAQPDLL